ncbi:MAG TPA: zinc ribbon domain-containing protein [Gemmataceae bacterium]|nr:zinc ribbon domain-containing protein [Gemmataceae bacterium]
MPQQVKCAACGRWLRFPDDLQEQWLTCPRCLAHVANPNRPAAGATAAGGTSTAVTEAYPVSPPIPTPPRTCPGCGKTLDPEWRFCPYCEHDAARRSLRRGSLSVDRDVRQDTRGTGCGLIGLAVLGAIGLAMALIPSFGIAAEMRSIGPLMPVTLVVLVLAGIATGIMFARTTGNPAARGVGRVILGTLVGAGIISLVILAGLVFLFIACMASSPRFR